jgi:hypothetical protein
VSVKERQGRLGVLALLGLGMIPPAYSFPLVLDWGLETGKSRAYGMAGKHIHDTYLFCSRFRHILEYIVDAGYVNRIPFLLDAHLHKHFEPRVLAYIRGFVDGYQESTCRLPSTLKPQL